MHQVDARVVVGPDSTIVEASSAALQMLGLSLEELQALPPGAMSLDEDRAATEGFESAWRDGGAGPIFGVGTVRLTDGRLLRLHYLITPRPDGTYELALSPSSEAPSEAPRMYTIGRVLSAWRAAERKLSTVPHGSPEWAATQTELDRFRTAYQDLARPHHDEPGGDREG